MEKLEVPKLWSNSQYQEFLEKHVGKKVEFKILANPKLYRGILGKTDWDHFRVDRGVELSLHCDYSSIEKMTIFSKGR